MARTHPLREQLKRWGYATANRFAANDDAGGSRESVLSRNRELAPGTRERAEMVLLGRDGNSRLRYMAMTAKVKGLEILPGWSCDPVPARNDASRPHTRRAVIDLGVPDELRWIDAALSSLERQWPMRAKIVREEYCTCGEQHEKAARVAADYGGKLTLRQYRYELTKAIDWIDAKQAA